MENRRVTRSTARYNHIELLDEPRRTRVKQEIKKMSPTEKKNVGIIYRTMMNIGKYFRINPKITSFMAMGFLLIYGIDVYPAISKTTKIITSDIPKQILGTVAQQSGTMFGEILKYPLDNPAEIFSCASRLYFTSDNVKEKFENMGSELKERFEMQTRKAVSNFINTEVLPRGISWVVDDAKDILMLPAPEDVENQLMSTEAVKLFYNDLKMVLYDDIASASESNIEGGMKDILCSGIISANNYFGNALERGIPQECAAVLERAKNPTIKTHCPRLYNHMVKILNRTMEDMHYSVNRTITRGIEDISTKRKETIRDLRNHLKIFAVVLLIHSVMVYLGIDIMTGFVNLKSTFFRFSAPRRHSRRSNSRSRSRSRSRRKSRSKSKRKSRSRRGSGRRKARRGRAMSGKRKKVPLSTMTVPDLCKKAKSMGLKGYSSMKKNDIIHMIRKHRK